MDTKCKGTCRKTEDEINVWVTTCIPANRTYGIQTPGISHRLTTNVIIITVTTEPSRAKCPGQKRNTERLKYLLLPRTEWVLSSIDYNYYFFNEIRLSFFLFRWTVLRRTRTNTGRTTGTPIGLVKTTVCQGWDYSKLERRRNVNSVKTNWNTRKCNLEPNRNREIYSEACLPRNFKWVK